MAATSAAFQDRIHAVASAIIKRMHTLASPVRLAVGLSTFRNRAGLLGSMLIAPINMRRNLPPANRTRVNQLIGEINADWDQLQFHVGLESEEAAVFDAWRNRTRERYMTHGLALVENTVRQLQEAEYTTLNAADFTARYVLAMQPVEIWRHRFFEILEHRYAEKARRAWRHLVTVISAALAIMVVAFLAIGRIYWRLQYPFLHVSRDVVELAHDRIFRARDRPPHDKALTPLFDAVDILADRLAERRAVTHQLRQLADMDSLTDLLNRRAFERQARQWLAGYPNEPISLISLDIDHFKQINDRYGHLAGDRVLCELANVLQGLTTDDVIASRFGGDEFAVLIRAGWARSQAIAGQLQTAVRGLEVGTDDDVTIDVAVSIGIAEATSSDLSSLMHAADEQLYAAKTQGRDCIRTTGGGPV
ncbi:diguanylate cyclase [Salinisphaera sp. Q1T1-3]|uniref:GGDEF domain-containing protein n=1 Tax=Salinisphaera sp. Q1T1-3 TaxID=2321229 RepID=UPI001F485CD6|nr:GGDEF domain-containing protein [Salinisphaera sp. Q1T1-3]